MDNLNSLERAVDSSTQCEENNSPELEIVDVIMAVDSESDEDYTQPHKFRRTVAAQNTWIEEHVAEGTYVSECIQMQTYMIPARLTLSMDLCSPAETIASECLRSGRVSWDSIARIMELLPQDSKPRWTSEDVQGGLSSKSFLTGAWARGPHFGLMRNTKLYPKVSEMLANVIHNVDKQHKFSTLNLARNVASKPHKDSQNAKGTWNLVLPCSKYTGGGLWIQQARGSTSLSMEGPAGHVWDTSTPTRFCPESIHATAPWGGDRLVLIGFHVRHVHSLPKEDALHLQRLGFNPVLEDI